MKLKSLLFLTTYLYGLFLVSLLVHKFGVPFLPLDPAIIPVADSPHIPSLTEIKVTVDQANTLGKSVALGGLAYVGSVLWNVVWSPVQGIIDSVKKGGGAAAGALADAYHNAKAVVKETGSSVYSALSAGLGVLSVSVTALSLKISEGVQSRVSSYTLGSGLEDISGVDLEVISEVGSGGHIINSLSQSFHALRVRLFGNPPVEVLTSPSLGNPPMGEPVATSAPSLLSGVYDALGSVDYSSVAVGVLLFVGVIAITVTVQALTHKNVDVEKLSDTLSDAGDEVVETASEVVERVLQYA